MPVLSSSSRHSVGDTKQPFCLQSCVKPLQYAVAVHEAGTEMVHRYVGMEPSGLKFNMLSLDDEGVWKKKTSTRYDFLTASVLFLTGWNQCLSPAVKHIASFKVFSFFLAAFIKARNVIVDIIWYKVRTLIVNNFDMWYLCWSDKELSTVNSFFSIFYPFLKHIMDKTNNLP